MIEKELVERRRKETERKRRQRAKMLEEKRAERRKEEAKQMRKRRARMTVEGKAEQKRKLVARNKECLARSGAIKEEPATLKERKVSRRKLLQGLRRILKEGELTEEEFNEKTREWKNQPKRRMTEEQQETRRSKDKFARVMKEIMDTPEEKAVRRERNRIYQRNYMKDPEKKKRWWQMITKCKNGFNVYQQKRRQNQAPEQRQKQLLGYGINKAKSELKKRLEESGESKEEIQRRLEALVAE